MTKVYVVIDPDDRTIVSVFASRGAAECAVRNYQRMGGTEDKVHLGLRGAGVTKAELVKALEGVPDGAPILINDGCPVTDVVQVGEYVYLSDAEFECEGDVGPDVPGGGAV